MMLLLCCLPCFSSGGLSTYCLNSWPCVRESSAPQTSVSCISICPETLVCKIWVNMSWSSHILNCLYWVYHILLLSLIGYATWTQEKKRKHSQSIIVVVVVCGFGLLFCGVFFKLFQYSYGLQYFPCLIQVNENSYLCVLSFLGQLQNLSTAGSLKNDILALMLTFLCFSDLNQILFIWLFKTVTRDFTNMNIDFNIWIKIFPWTAKNLPLDVIFMFSFCMCWEHGIK